MKMKREIYNKVLNSIPPIPHETGGILGGNNGVVTEFIFDMGLPGGDIGHYYPNTDKLNSALVEWQKFGIEFYGIVHSHFNFDNSLSLDDELYIRKIMMAMPDTIKMLYFPIVLPRKEILPFKAERIENEIDITLSDIELF